MENQLITKHLENWDGLKKASIEHYAKTGNISGSLFIAMKEMMNEYCDIKTKELEAENKQLQACLSFYQKEAWER